MLVVHSRLDLLVGLIRGGFLLRFGVLFITLAGCLCARMRSEEGKDSRFCFEQCFAPAVNSGQYATSWAPDTLSKSVRQTQPKTSHRP
jgi:hypothetical protein